MRRLAVVLAFGVLMASAASLSNAQVAPSIEPSKAAPEPEEEAQLEDIVVNGRRAEQLARTYVEAVADPPRGARVASWRNRVCVSVTGWRARLGQMVADGVGRRAMEMGLEVGQPGCDPNIVIVATHDAPLVATAMYERWPWRFRPPFQPSSPSLAALRRFQTSEVPVRWWHVSAPFFTDSNHLAARWAGELPPRGMAYGSGRLKSNHQYDILEATVIVDLRHIGDVHFASLIDYIAMVSLAQVDPLEDRTGLPTILNLFAPDQSHPQMTEWDIAYLGGLANARPDMATPAQQRTQVRRQMLRARDRPTDRGRSIP